MIKIVLKPEDLTFIDNYLTNNHVIFTDIKAEMLDHIANAVEEKMQTESLDFYDAFKEYMVKNKKEIMKMNKETSLDFSFSSFHSLVVFLTKPFSLFLASTYFFICFLFLTVLIQSLITFIIISIIIILLMSILMYLIYWKNKIRIYQLEKNFSIVFLSYLVFNILFQITNNTNVMTIGILFILYVYFNYLVYFYINLKKYQKI